MTPDSVFTFASSMDLFWLVLALAGGAFGAMIGANFAFAFTGVSILVGFAVAATTGSTIYLDYVAFGPVFGPHIAFAGGVGAASYAARKGLLPGGGRATSTRRWPGWAGPTSSWSARSTASAATSSTSSSS